MLEITYNRFTNKTDGLESGDFQVRSRLRIVDESQKRSDEVWPLIVWKLNSRNSSDDLSSYATRFRRRRAKTDKGFSLDFISRACVCRQPPVCIFILPCALLNVCKI